MPLYVYSCSECEIVVEELRPMDMADWPVECPVCHDFCERELSSFSVRRNGRTSAVPADTGNTPAERKPVMAHGSGCPCCGPRGH